MRQAGAAGEWVREYLAQGGQIQKVPENTFVVDWSEGGKLRGLARKVSKFGHKHKRKKKGREE